MEDLKRGFTPNPDILCNREIKFRCVLGQSHVPGSRLFSDRTLCRTQKISDKYALLRGRDPGKDQSYFLYTVTHDKLAKTLFPIGDMEKSEVRRLAAEHGLPTASKKDSTGICFIGKRNFKEFISQYLSYTRGDFVSLEGKIVGKHDGVAY